MFLDTFQQIKPGCSEVQKAMGICNHILVQRSGSVFFLFKSCPTCRSSTAATWSLPPFLTRGCQSNNWDCFLLGTGYDLPKPRSKRAFPFSGMTLRRFALELRSLASQLQITTLTTHRQSLESSEGCAIKVLQLRDWGGGFMHIYLLHERNAIEPSRDRRQPALPKLHTLPFHRSKVVIVALVHLSDSCLSGIAHVARVNRKTTDVTRGTAHFPVTIWPVVFPPLICRAVPTRPRHMPPGITAPVCMAIGHCNNRWHPGLKSFSGSLVGLLRVACREGLENMAVTCGP